MSRVHVYQGAQENDQVERLAVNSQFGLAKDTTRELLLYRTFGF